MHRVALSIRGVRGAWAWAGYDTGLGRALGQAKSRGDLALFRLLAGDFAHRVSPRLDGAFSCVVAAPSTAWSRFRRGFSGASVAAAAIAASSGLPLVHALTRGAGPQQARLGRDARRRNLRGKVRGEVQVAGRVLLIDDVVTTGATAEACARELLGSGAEEVWVAALCVARSHPRPAADTALSTRSPR